MERYSTELGTWEEAVLKLISGREKKGIKITKCLLYSRHTKSYILYVSTFIDSFNKYL